MLYQIAQTPLGPMLMAGSKDKLQILAFVEPLGLEATLAYWADKQGPTRNDQQDPWIEKQSALFDKAHRELDLYFQGRLQRFSIPMDWVGTRFQIQVWQTLQNIPWGRTCSYLELAREVGRPKAYRAVANANGANPLCIIVPCHRVIHANGGLGGYGFGMDKKIWLLQHEGVL